jgi:hypothetical protein
MARGFEIVDTFTAFTEKAPGVLKDAAIRGVQKVAPRMLGRMEAQAPTLTGQMKSKLTVDGGVVGIFDPEQAEVALFNEYSPNHQPFMRAAAQASIGDLESDASAEIVAAESELKE